MINYLVWDTKKLSIDEFFQLTVSDQLKYLCTLGHLAPSSHNTQPWRFEIDEKKYQITIFLDRNCILPVSDVIGRQSIISIGCCIKNIEIASSYFGMSIDIVYSSITVDDTRPTKNASGFLKIAELNFQKSDHDIDNDLFSVIWERKVNRAEYDTSKNIAPEVVEKIVQPADSDDVYLHIIDDKLRKFALAEFQSQAEGYVINNSNFSKELGHWLLPNDTKEFLGMPGFGFGFSDEDSLRIHQGLLNQGSKLEPEDTLKFSLAAKKGMEQSSFIGLIMSDQDTPMNWLSAGRYLERTLLYLTSQGIQTAIHAAIVEVPLINAMFAASIGTTKKILCVFRVGHVKYEKDLLRPHSPRLPLEKVLLASS